ncbi:MAG TPA: hypothetical protein VFU05_11740 [Cyclobacteriaceae bacterium]|nr:hypothetical protein [Cyclobacteriaceae bacterium]
MSAALQQWLDETLAVLVLYKTPLRESVTYTSLSEALKKSNGTIDWFVYDNSPTIRENNSPDTAIIFRSDTSNPGVSRAYNEGFKMAESLGKKWLLLLDQDTHFPIDAIEKYHNFLVAYPQESCFIPRLTDRVGIISPFKFRLGNGFRISSVSDGIQSFNKLHFVNSGLMISVNSFRQAKGYDEAFPLDFSDYAFIEKIRTVHESFVLISLIANHGHSSLQGMEVHEELERFTHFTSAAKIFRKKYHPGNWLIILRPFLRAVKLSVRHKTLAFVKQYFDSMWHD